MIKRREWLRKCAGGTLLLLFDTGCEQRSIDEDKAFDTEPRNNRSGAPAVGTKQNPGRPKSYRPEEPNPKVGD